MRFSLHDARALPPCRVALTLIAAWLLSTCLPFATQAQQRAATTDVGRTITYEEALQIAFQRNYRLRLAENDVSSNSVSVASNRAEYLPNLAFSSATRRDYGRSFSQEQGGIVNQTSTTSSFNLNSGFTVFDGFRRDATLDQAQAQVRASSQTLTRRRQDVAFEVISGFIELAQNRNLVSVRDSSLELRRQQLTQAEAQIEVGERAPSEVYLIQADVAAAKQALLQAQRNVQISETNLTRLLVLDPFAEHAFDVEAIEEAAQANVALPDESRYEPVSLLKSAYASRADLGSQLASIAAAEQGVRAARADYWPSLSLSAGYGTNWTTQARPLPGEAGRPGFFNQLDNRRGGSVTFSFRMPVFDRLQRRFNIDQSEVQVQNARFQRQQLRQDIAVEVRQALIDYRNAQTSLEVSAERLKAARQALDAAEERYRLGAATYIELTQANSDFVEAQSNEVNARYSLLLEQRRLDYITGTFDPRAPLLP